MSTLAETQTLLSRYSGQGNTFVDRLNLVRSRLIQSGILAETKQEIVLPVYADEYNNSIVTLPRQFRTILAGAVQSDDVLCSGMPMGVANEWVPFNKNGSGYPGFTDDFQEVPGRFCVYQEWTGAMRLRFKFEAAEDEGVFHVRGEMDGTRVYSLFPPPFGQEGDTVWIEGEKVPFDGATVTTVKYFAARNLSVVKPVTNGRVFMCVIDDDDNEALVAVYDPGETVPRWRRYRVPQCDDTSSAVLGETIILPVDQYFTAAEILYMFAHGGTITVSAAGTHDLVYGAYLSRIVKVVASAGSGSYTHKFLLDSSSVKEGGTLRVQLAVAASANPTLQFYDNTESVPISEATVIGDSDNTTTYTLVFSFDGTNWNYEGRET